jgi:hypothetical protein
MTSHPIAYRRAVALGAEQVPTAPAQQPWLREPGPRPSDKHPGWLEVPAFYTVSIVLGGEDNAQNGSAVGLRPERFELRRITFATQGDVWPFVSFPALSSIQGRCVEVTWGDEFTQFLGQQPCLLSALLGDSNGFLDLPEGILFQGRQTLNAKLRRLQWPDPATEPAPMRFDINFQGVGLLPGNSGGFSGGL